MSREQRRTERKTQARGAAGAPPPSRRTPVKVAGGGRFPLVPIGIAAGVLAVILLLAYLIYQSGKPASTSASEKARLDRSTDIPGTYVEDQGRTHLTGGYTSSRTPIPFCDGVPHSGASPAAGTSPTAQASSTPVPAGTSTPGTDATASGSSTSASSKSPGATPTVPTNCRNSNPPSSGPHLNVQRKVDVGGGNIINIPADPNVYPPDVQIPRDAIPHILEHAGVFVGYNCADGDSACQDVVSQLTDLVNSRIDDHGNRVVMANDSDLVPGTIGLSSWTRVLDFKYQDYDKNLVERFISVNSCRFDPEGFC